MNLDSTDLKLTEFYFKDFIKRGHLYKLFIDFFIRYIFTMTPYQFSFKILQINITLIYKIFSSQMRSYFSFLIIS